MSGVRIPPRMLPIAAILVACAPVLASAEFYRWTDAQGNQHISNIPERGFDADGRIRRDFHPYSVAAQRARMRADLERHAADLARSEAGRGRSSNRDGKLLPELPDLLALPAADGRATPGE